MVVDPPREARAILAPVIVHTFAELGVTLTLRADDEWYPLHVAPSVLPFELELGVESLRWPYNDACFDRARRTKAPVLGQHTGLSDWFVPICDERTMWGILVAGPFATARPKAEDVLERWRSMTGTHPHPSDPRFAAYLSATLATLTLDGGRLGAFERLLSCFAALLAGKGDVQALSAEASALRTELLEARFAEAMWDAAASLLDPRTTQIWTTRFKAEELMRLGLARPPEHAAVGLIAGRADEPDPVSDVIRRDELQRACVELAREAGSVCGRLGGHGVALLGHARPADLAERAAKVARRLGLALHLGIGEAKAGSLVASYETALGAAEAALAERLPLVEAEKSPVRRGKALPSLRRDLLQAVMERPSVLVARFERYLEAVAAECGHALVPSRVELEVLLERLAETLVGNGVLDDKSWGDMRNELARAAARASTVHDLFAAYRRTVVDIESALLRPVEAHKERSVRRAMLFIREHLSEPLSLSAVARVAGFAPGYFSKLFKREQKTTLEEHIRRLRIESAKQLLHNTELNLERVAQLSGFGTRSHFHQAFRKALGMTPLEYREKTWWSGESAHDRAASRLREPRKATARTPRR